MKPTPFVSLMLFGAALLCGFIALTASWSVNDDGTLMKGSVTPWHSCLSLAPTKLASFLLGSDPLVDGSAAACFQLSKARASELFASLGDATAAKTAGLLLASRVCLLLSLVAIVLGTLVTFIQSFSAHYARVGALIPLFLSITAMTLGIIACAMWGAVARHGLNAGDPSVFHVHTGPGFVSGLLATIFSGCALIPSVVDIAIPHRKPAHAE